MNHVIVASDRTDSPQSPVVLKRYIVPHTAKLFDRLLGKTPFYHQPPHCAFPRVERGRKVTNLKLGRIDSTLQAEAVMYDAQESGKTPLILLIASGGAKC